MAAPQIAEAYDDVSPVTAPVHYGEYTNDSTPVLHVALGDQAQAGERLLLQDNGALTGQAVTLTAADVSRGYVDLQLSSLGEGWHPFNILLAGADGGALATSMPFALGVATAAPAAPSITAAADDFGAATGAVADGGRTDDATLTLRIFEDGLPSNPTSSPGHAPYGGPAIQGGLVYVYDGTTLVGQARLLTDGEVSVTTDNLAPGEHVLTAVAVDRAGNVSATSAGFHVVIGDDGGASAGAPDRGASDHSAQSGAGADTLIGLDVAGVLRGGAGDDAITGGTQFNDINGNTGADTIVGRSVVGDWLLGGQGDDVITAALSTGHNIVNGNLGADTLTGGGGGDVLRGGQAADVIVGGDGADWISGDLGDDTLAGHGGADVFHAGGGADVVLDFDAANGDRVQVDAGVTYSFAQSGDDVVVTFSNGGHLTLEHTQQSSLAEGWIFAA
jgi:Ca2+-binding RTX toxin-like protein